jgi:nucleoside-diphosphate-sugar epimerase
MKILLTGANGFVGKAVLKAAQMRGFIIRPIYRSVDSAMGQPDAVLVPELDSAVDWSKALQGVDVVIHAAARAHIMQEESLDSLAEYWRVNVDGTLNLARQAAGTGVRRFVFISSIKVNGEQTVPGCPFTANDPPAPQDAYGLSKAEAEMQLRQVARETGLEVTIVRPPLIYGLGVKGNLASLISWVRRGVPLPLGGVTCNRRSLVYLDNLVDLILVCTDHPKAADHTFLVSDGEDLSTTELLRRICKASGQKVNLIWVPARLISFISALIGKKLISQRLLGSLQVDIHKTCELLDWKPSVSVDEGLSRTLNKIE